MTAMVRAAGLTRRFGELAAVDGLNLEVGAGEIFGLVGPDGAGKTTTLRLLASVLEPSAGDAWVAGHHVRREAEQVKLAIGYMSQRFGLYGDLTVAENIAFYADLYGVPTKELRPRVERLLQFSNLGPFQQRLAGHLSGGMKQKLGLICALVHTPQVLLLDEPTNGVDPVSRRDFWKILYQMVREGVTVVVSTAYLDEAERCGRIGLLDHGRLLACASPDEVKKLVPHAILEVRVPSPRAAAHLLRQTLGARAVGIFGDKLHVMAPDPEAVAAQVRTLLDGAGMGPVATRPVPPSLEDVFVSVLTEVQDAPTAPAPVT